MINDVLAHGGETRWDSASGARVGGRGLHDAI
jgi:hypothetical protein